jgi:ABC-2 type transport system permease protein
MIPFFRAYGLLLRWQAGRFITLIPLLVIVQALLSTGVILGLGMLVSNQDSQAAGYLATGAPTVALITVGLVVVPLQVSEAKAEGSIDFLWAMPVPRLAYLFADLTLWLLVSLPGMTLSVIMAKLRFDIPITPSLLTLPTILLVALTATSIGYAIAVSLPPVLAQLTAQALVFVVLMFSPINYPSSRLPSWAASVHQVLPFQAMGDALRHAIAPQTFAVDSLVYPLLVLYCIVGLILTQHVMNRRG